MKLAAQRTLTSTLACIIVPNACTCVRVRQFGERQMDNFGKRWSCEFSAFEPNRIWFLSIF